MKILISRFPRVLSLFVFVGFFSAACAAETDPDGALFDPSPDALADVHATLDRAAENERMGLVVIGANWCHDSRALAARLNKSPLSEVIRENYELVFVDVGYLEKGRDVTNEFGVANYYATPTVLIIDPAKGRLVNDEDRHMWGDAYKIDMPTSVEYFERWASNDEAEESASESAQLAKLYAEIEKFESAQADRVDAGYAVVGPMLAAYKAGNEADDFDARWYELRDFRVAIPEDVRILREEALRRVSEGEENIELHYPEYPTQFWEN